MNISTEIQNESIEKDIIGKHSELKDRMYKLKFHSVTTSVDLPKLSGVDVSLLGQDYEEDKKHKH